MKKTLVLGATPNPARYAYLATNRRLLVQFSFNLRADVWLSILCAEDEMNEDGRQGLRHVFGLAFFLFALSALLVLVRYTFLGPLAQAITFRAFGA